MVTQREIAREVGLDVSSVNKILNRINGPVFKKKTIERVMKVALRRGYNFNRPSKGTLAAQMRDLFPQDWTEDHTAEVRGVPIERVRTIKEMLYGKKSA